MKRIDICKSVLDTLIGIGVTAIVGAFVKRLKEDKKKESLDNTMVSDLTGKELGEIIRKIFKEEMEA